ncbi:MAG: hypothetical protein QNL62_00420 [Gammaproteobacteria bacterium]|nr:hypothetical protein [Gammaproteobacteria bacterium]
MILKKINAYFITISLILLLVTFSLMMSGCSPHPGAGKWQADGSNTLNVSRIKIVFEGQADLYIDGHEDSIRRCFWSAKDKRTLQMQCVYSDNTDKKEAYQFTVTETGQARLSQNDQLIGLFSEQALQD